MKIIKAFDNFKIACYIYIKQTNDNYCLLRGGNEMTRNWELYIARNEAGHSQADVAKKLGITKQRYGLKELGKAHFTIPEAKVLSELYGMTLDELFSNEIKIGS